MKTTQCRCGNRLFFGNPICISCQTPVALCDGCDSITPIDLDPPAANASADDPPSSDAASSDGASTGSSAACESAADESTTGGSATVESTTGESVLDDSASERTRDTAPCDRCHRVLRWCANHARGVCGGGVVVDGSDDSANSDDSNLCKYCRLNATIPDLGTSGNLEKWGRLENAKRRVLYDIAASGLPIDDETLPLRFDFLAATDDAPVSTGHANGLITIDIAEADSVIRERTRVEFGEPQRTLVGHFRHELGHYYWQLIVEPNMLDACRELFGDETDPTYVEARDVYYANGPVADWPLRFVSAYASMHPWEDFAETFAMYFDIIAILNTAEDFKRVVGPKHPGDFKSMIRSFMEIGLAANAMNRDLGLIDLVPEVLVDPVLDKLKFIHKMVNQDTA